MKSFIFAMLLIVAFTGAPQVEAGNGHFGVRGFSVHGNGFHGQNFHGQARVQGNNGFRSAGGRRLVFVGFDRFGNPVFR